MTLLDKPLGEMTREEIMQAVEERDKRVAQIRAENAKYIPPVGAPMLISDDLGINGLFCHADGKTYDSKSAYYKAVRAAGMEIVGNEKLKSNPNQKEIDWSRAVKESLERKGY